MTAYSKFLKYYILPTWFGRGTLPDKKEASCWKFYPVLCPEQDISYCWLENTLTPILTGASTQILIEQSNNTPKATKINLVSSLHGTPP